MAQTLPYPNGDWRNFVVRSRHVHFWYANLHTLECFTYQLGVWLFGNRLKHVLAYVPANFSELSVYYIFKKWSSLLNFNEKACPSSSKGTIFSKIEDLCYKNTKRFKQFKCPHVFLDYNCYCFYRIGRIQYFMIGRRIKVYNFRIFAFCFFFNYKSF